MPVVNAGIDATVLEQGLFTLSGTASDADGTLTGTLWTQDSGPAVTLSDPTSLTPNFTAPDVTQNETLIFTLTATDNDNDSASDSVTITVQVNVPPSVNAGPDQSVDEQTLVSLAGSATDGENAIVSTTWTQTQGTVVALSDASILNPTFTAPDITSNETLIFSLQAVDALGEASSDTVSINLVANLPPSVNAGTDQVVQKDAVVALTGVISDSDGTIASIQWTQTAGPNVTLSNATTANTSFTAPLVATDTVFTFDLTATDNDGDAATDTVNITVQAPPTIASLTFNDTALQTCVTSWAASNSYTYIFEMIDLTCASAGVSDLTGLDQLNFLQVLNFNNNTISSIAPLANLPLLYDINFGTNNISDISPLTGLGNLQTVTFISNNISDVSPLANKTQLTFLSVPSNNITDVSALSTLPNIQSLFLYFNNISDVSPLSFLPTLTTLYLYGNNISDASPLSSLPNISALYLNSNSISDISSLSSLTTLTELYLGQNSITDISSLSALTSLTKLSLDNNSITDISALNGLTLLTLLELDGNSIDDLTPLTSLSVLDLLDLNVNPTRDITPLQSLTSLSFLFIQGMPNILCPDVTTLTSVLSATTIFTDICVAGFTQAEITTRYFLIDDANTNTLSRGLAEFFFDNVNLIGSVQEVKDFSNRTVDSFTWLINNGRIDITMGANGVVTTPTYTTIEEMTSDAATIAAFNAGGGFNGGSQQVTTTDSVDSYLMTRVSDTARLDRVTVETVKRRSYADITLADQSVLTVPDLVKTDTSEKELRDIDTLIAEIDFATQAGCVAGTACVEGDWGGIYHYSPGFDLNFSTIGESAYGSYMTFALDGSVVENVAGDNGTWGINAGVLEVTNAAGVKQFSYILEQSGVEYSVLSLFDTGQYVFANIDRWVKNDAGFALDETYLQNPGGEFWNSDLNLWQVDALDGNGDRTLVNQFGWILAAAGAGLGYDWYDNAGTLTLQELTISTWSVLAGELRLDKTSDTHRNWYSVKSSTIDGDRVFYVIETEYVAIDGDGVQITPRLNIYRELPLFPFAVLEQIGPL